MREITAPRISKAAATGIAQTANRTPLLICSIDMSWVS